MTLRSPVMAEPHLREVAEDVYAYIQPDGGWCLNNAGLITSGGRSALIDTAATEARTRALREAVAAITTRAPRFVVNTHPHGDHTFGNRFFADEAVIVSHEGTRAEMDLAQLHLTGLWPEVCWGDVSVELPSLTYRGVLTLHLGDTQAELMHLGTAHTRNDTVVWLPRQRVLFTGDVVMSGATPFCLTGSISGSLDVIGHLRSLNPESVVSGHGPVGGAELLDETMRLPSIRPAPGSRRHRRWADSAGGGTGGRAAPTPACSTANGWCPTCTGLMPRQAEPSPVTGWTSRSCFPRWSPSTVAFLPAGPDPCPVRTCIRRGTLWYFSIPATVISQPSTG
ncbi:MBL fold metallo-hydrolase [Streptomyces indonesiensis]